jgi:hypothetical protein
MADVGDAYGWLILHVALSNVRYRGAIITCDA